MYVIPFSMGPVGGNLSKIGVQLTDFNYVLLSMRIMTRVTSRVWHIIGDGDFVKCVHSIGSPRPLPGKHTRSTVWDLMRACFMKSPLAFPLLE